MKLWKKLLIGLLAALAGIILCRGAIANLALSIGVRAVTGLRLEIRHLAVGIAKPRVVVEDLKLFNPPGFQDPIMVDLPKLEVNVDLGAFLRGRTHLRHLDLYLREFIVVKNEKGELNLDSVTAVQKARAKSGGKMEKGKPAQPPNSFEIDELHLRVGKVIYKDYSRGPTPDVREFSVNLDERYNHVTDPAALGALIVSRALVRTTIAGLAQFSLEDLGGLLEKSAGTAGETAAEAMGLLKKVLPLKE